MLFYKENNIGNEVKLKLSENIYSDFSEGYIFVIFTNKPK